MPSSFSNHVRKIATEFEKDHRRTWESPPLGTPNDKGEPALAWPDQVFEGQSEEAHHPFLRTGNNILSRDVTPRAHQRPIPVTGSTGREMLNGVQPPQKKTKKKQNQFFRLINL